MSFISRTEEIFAVSYDNIHVSPFGLESLVDLKIVKKINEHSRIYLTGIISSGQRDRYVMTTGTQTPVEVSQSGGDSGSICLFNGIVTNLRIKSVRDIYYIEIEGVSSTFDMDIKIKNRSFQFIEMQYIELIKEVLAGYSGSDFIDTAAQSKMTGNFIVQYNETDWEFLKRMASHFNIGLVPDEKSGKPRFWFGIPEGDSKGNLEDYHFSVRKKISDFRVSSENFIPEIEVDDFIYYEVETDKLLGIGDIVTFNDKNLYVCESVTQIKNSILKHDYVLSPNMGLRQNMLYNKGIAGVSIEGRVIDIKEDNVRIHLEIDRSQNKEEAFWFPYSTFYTSEGSTGWYCMPELGDSVKLYFPTFREEDGIVINSIRKGTSGGDKILKPDIKYFRTIFGKELMFTEKEVVITAKDGEVLIRLNEDEGIEVFSTKQVKIFAKEDITIDSGKKMVLTAGEEIDINCKTSNIKMDGITYIKGKQVRTN